MTFFATDGRGGLFSQVAATALVAVTLAGCSSGFSRLSDGLTTSTSLTPNQMTILRKQGPASQPYPGDLDQQANASAARTGVIDATRGGSAYSTAVQKRPLAPPAGGEAEGSENLVTAESRKLAGDEPVSLLAKNQVDSDMKTASVAKPAVGARTAARSKSGWSPEGGTYVTLRHGETLHNLSERYGVPVKQIKRANAIGHESEVRAGSKVLIPTYNYTRKAAVSAPDAGSTGAAVPKYKPARDSRAATVQPLKLPDGKQGGQSGAYTVTAGDTLFGIARRHHVSVDGLRQANALDGDRLRLGQTLTIPAAGTVQAVSLKTGEKNPGVDAIVTGSSGGSAPKKKPRVVGSAKASAAYTAPDASAEIARKATEQAEAPDRSGISKFRWPARGRVIGKYGNKVNGKSNDGIDISMPEGTPVKAAENGKVIYAGSELEDFGNLVLVRHADGWVSAYAHARENLVKRGDTVKRGQVIAHSGKTGNAARPKLHFELRKNSKPVNPSKHLDQT